MPGLVLDLILLAHIFLFIISAALKQNQGAILIALTAHQPLYYIPMAPEHNVSNRPLAPAGIPITFSPC